MTIYSKLRLLVQAKSEQPIRHLIEHNDIQIFEQELREAQSLIKQSKMHLASIKADIQLLNDTIDDQKADITRREEQTLEAFETSPDLVDDLAARIAEMDNELNDMQTRQAKLKSTEERVTRDLKQAVRTIKNHQQQLVILKANEAQGRINEACSLGTIGLNSGLSELNESLRSIEERQMRHHALDEAVATVDTLLSGNDLDKRVHSAGIRSGKHDAKAVIARLKKRTKQDE